MKKVFLVVILFLGFLLGCVGTKEAPNSKIEITDMAGYKVSFNQSPKRAVFLAGESWIYALGIKDKVVAVSDLAKRNPLILKIDPEIKEIPSVGDMAKANDEAILSLKPDVIVVWDEPPGYRETAKRLERLGIPIIRVGHIEKYPEDICKQARILGEIFNAEKRAENVCNYIKEKWMQISTKRAEKEVKVLYTFTTSTYIACKDNAYAVFIEAVGGKVVHPECNTTWIQVSKEWILEADPEVWIISYYANYNESAILNDPALKSVKAIKNGKVFKESYRPMQFLEPYFLLTVFEYSDWINPGSFSLAKEEEELITQIYLT